jgi:hypothetical protein
MGSNKPWIPFYPSDWLNGTAGLKIEEVGVYIQVTALLYDSDNAIELDRIEHPVTGKLQGYCYKALAHRFGMRADKFERIVTSLIKRKKLSEQAGFLTSNRVARELAKREQKSNRNREAAQHRWSFRQKNVFKINR